MPNQAIFDTADGYSVNTLRKIVRLNNRKIRETGDLIPITIGHTDTEDFGEENNSPPVVGYADRLRLGKLGKSNRVAIFARFKIFKDAYPKIKGQYEYKSVELWDDLDIHPISLLRQRPAKQLGMLSFSKNRKCVAKYSRLIFERGDMPDKEELQELILETLEDSPMGQFVKKMMADDEHKNDEPELNNEDEEKDPELMQEDEDELRKKLEDKEKELEQFKRKFATQERKQKLQRFAAQYKFDVNEELDFCKSMSDKQFSKHINRIPKLYQKAPVGVRLNIGDFPSDNSIKHNREKAAEVTKYAAATGCTYEQAIKKLNLG